MRPAISCVAVLALLTGGARENSLPSVLPNDTFRWRARPWTLYFLESSTDAVNWQWVQTIIPPHVVNFPTTTVNASTTAPRDPLQGRRLLRVRQLQ